MGNSRFKFRLWDKDNEVYDYIDFCNLSRTNETLTIYEEYFYNGYFEHNQDCIEQCTGLKDKNGNLIYEGDVVKIGNGSINGEVMESELAVEWVDKIGRWNLPNWTSDSPDWSHYVEIIGNIHKQAEQKDE